MGDDKSGSPAQSVVSLSNGNCLFSVIRCLNGQYAVVRDGWMIDDRRWNDSNIDEAITACIDVSGVTESIMIVVCPDNAEFNN